ncbi:MULTISPECIES: SCO2522 family protein [unclassified Streptomyces]|uniref:SCO2522 family protein n=1 Tax=unclassified Streptomyces TaxID=2593676 RepID=UPI002366A42B|nr:MULTISPECIES: SCO2522 family protein [unclassified Streptomyces]MDF3141113.1 SCO2522 family protein [Streptomyces sp. T21Q-yed]WDF37948.1 SCO2522 family protein [Streptomyces sp. T12]
MTEAVFRETTAEPVTKSVPLSHLSLELGHLYMEDFEAGPDRLREHFAEVRIWVDAVRASAARRSKRPRISTCFLIDDYFTRFSTPAELIPMVLKEAEKAGLVIDYLARESACAVADRIELAESVMHRLVESPPPGSYGSRPPVSQTGWLANGQRTPTMSRSALGEVKGWQPPQETAARNHSVFMDVELWSEKDGRRLWSCPFLAAVWQLARLGLLRHLGEPVLEPQEWKSEEFPHDWDRLPPLIKLTHTTAAFSAYRTCTLMPNRFLAVEDAVRLILDQIDVDAGALQQVADRSAGEGMAVPAAVAQRATYVFYEEPGDSSAVEGT